MNLNLRTVADVGVPILSAAGFFGSASGTSPLGILLSSACFAGKDVLCLSLD